MFRRQSQNSAHVAALGVAWTDAVAPLGEPDIAIAAQVHDNLRISRESMNVPRFMVLGIGDEQDFAEADRRHATKYNLSDLGYQIRPCY